MADILKLQQMQRFDLTAIPDAILSERRPSGIETELLYDVTGNKAIALPKQWPLARPQLATRQERLERSELRLGFAWALQNEQHTQGIPVLPPCSWCGHPTGGYCDLCTTTVANPVCSACGGTASEIIATCRRCLPRGRS